MSQHTDTSNLEIISTAIETLRTQIALIQKRNPGDDLSKRLHESVIATTDNLVAEINKLLDDGAVDYNKLVDQFEEYQQAVNDGLIRFSQVTGVSATVESLVMQLINLPRICVMRSAIWKRVLNRQIHCVNLPKPI